MFIQHNSNAFNIYRNWKAQESVVSTAMRRLSSGQRINSAADDAAGLGITERMKALLRMNEADQKCTDNNISQCETQDATLGQVHSMLNRMAELSTQSMNGTFGEQDRHNLDAEYQQLSDEINRIAPAKTSLFEDKGNEASEEKNAVVYQTDNIVGYVDSLNSFLNKVNSAVQSNDYDMAKELGIDLSDNLSNSQRLRIAVSDFTTKNLEGLSVNAKGSGVYSVAVSEDNVSIKMGGQDGDILGLKGTNLLSSKAAGEACEKVKKAIQSVSEWCGNVGAMSNLMERTKSRLEDMEVNLTDSLSRILDTDMAKESMNLVRGQMLTQANAFLMAQANKQSDLVLKLLN